jgi:hypothetical protein
MSPIGVHISRDHFLSCRALDGELLDALPSAPLGVNKIDHALNCLPVNPSSGPPPFWSALLSLLHAIDCITHPLAVIPQILIQDLYGSLSKRLKIDEQ